MWKSSNLRENTLSLVLDRMETIELIAVIGKHSINESIQEFNLLEQVPLSFRTVVDNINRPGHPEEMRFQLHKLTEEDDSLLNTHLYEGNAVGKYWVDITNPSGLLDIGERWGHIQLEIDKLKSSL